MLLRAVLVVPYIAQLDALAEPWRRLFECSTLLATIVLFGHLGGLLAAGSLSLAGSRGLLRRAGPGAESRRRDLAERLPLHAPMIAAFGVALLSGLLLFLADVEAFAASPIFWTKMLLAALLLGNAVLAWRLDRRLRRTIDDDSDCERLWRWRRVSAMAGVALWFAVVLAGTALANH